MAYSKTLQTQEWQLLANKIQQEEEEVEKNTNLHHTFKCLETFLFVFGFHQCSFLSILLSWSAFLILGIVIPVLIIELSSCSDCERFQVPRFELSILVSRVVLAAGSLLCISHNLRKYGVRKFLLISFFHGQMTQFGEKYNEKIKAFFRVLISWILPCILVKTAHDIICNMYVYHNSWWQVAVLLGSLVSWTYLTTIFLSACLLFNLVGNLQIIHSQDYRFLLQRESDGLILLAEHLRLRHHLSKISHRFRIFLLLTLVVVTVSQFATLFQTLGNRGYLNFINGGNFAVSSIVEVVGITVCLYAAAKISHRAQGIASVATRWHALVTMNSPDGSKQLTDGVNFEAELAKPLLVKYSESDMESSFDHTALLENSQLASYMSSYHTRVALVSYFQSNPGGLTVFGWTVDRSLISTIFFIELSLVLFVLGKVFVFTSK